MSIVKANKYQTLAGATMPVPVQFVYGSDTTYISSTSQSWVTAGPTLSITPKFSTSLIKCELELNLWINSNTSQGGINGSWWANINNAGWNNITSAGLVTFHNTNTQDSRITRISNIYAPNTTNTVQIRYMIAVNSAYSSLEMITNWPSSANGGIPAGGTKSYLYLTEIAQ